MRGNRATHRPSNLHHYCIGRKCSNHSKLRRHHCRAITRLRWHSRRHFRLLGSSSITHMSTTRRCQCKGNSYFIHHCLWPHRMSRDRSQQSPRASRRQARYRNCLHWQQAASRDEQVQVVHPELPRPQRRNSSTRCLRCSDGTMRGQAASSSSRQAHHLSLQVLPQLHRW
jgi:hypothetical protein